MKFSIDLRYERRYRTRRRLCGIFSIFKNNSPPQYMENSFEVLNELWLQALFNDPDFQAFIIFGPLKIAHMNPLPMIENEIHTTRQFLEDLQELCLKYDLEIGPPVPLLNSHLPFSPLRKLAHPLASSLQEFYEETIKRIKLLEEQKKNIIKLNAKENIVWKDRPGRKPMPISFAEKLLVAFDLYSNSKENLQKFKDYIKPNGPLSQKILAENSNNTEVLEILLLQQNPDLYQWKKETKRSLVLKLLSHRKKKEVRSTGKYPDEVAAIKAYIAQLAEHIRISRRVSAKNLRNSF